MQCKKKSDFERLSNNRYGLYAVVVHAGGKLDGGHYFTYARESDSDLTVEDDEEYVFS